jgi:hypothetical protein
MSALTGYKYQGTDLSYIFQSGNSGQTTNYKSNGIDLGNIFASITSGTSIGYNIGYQVNGIDFSQIFAKKEPFDISYNANYTKDYSNNYFIITFPVQYPNTSGSDGSNNGNGIGTIKFLQDLSINLLLVAGGGGGAGGSAGGGGGGGGGNILYKNMRVYSTNTYHIRVGTGGKGGNEPQFNPGLSPTNGIETVFSDGDISSNNFLIKCNGGTRGDQSRSGGLIYLNGSSTSLQNGGNGGNGSNGFNSADGFDASKNMCTQIINNNQPTNPPSYTYDISANLIFNNGQQNFSGGGAGGSSYIGGRCGSYNNNYGDGGSFNNSGYGNSAGENATAYGPSLYSYGGGGGGGSISGNKHGGFGADGIMKIYFYYP